MTRRVLIAACFVALGPSALAADPAAFKLPSVGGWVMTADNVTLIVSVPTKGELVYFDTVADKEVKRIEVDFQPMWLALQGDSLFAAGKGSSTVYQLDAKSGKEIRKIKLPGEPVDQIACHPTKGLVYASNSQQEIFSIDPKTGKAVKTAARGMFLAVDPVAGDALYAASLKPAKEKITVRDGPNGTLSITFDTTGNRAVLLKYSIVKDALKLVDGTDNAAIGVGGALAMSPDGKSVAFVASGGWRSKSDAKQHVEIAVFDTGDLKSMRGSVEAGAPKNLVFHPVLKMGIGLGDNVDLHYFNPKSLVIRKKESLKRMPHTFWFNLLAFGAKGTKLIYLQGENLLFVPLELSAEERDALDAFYGKRDK